MYDKPKFYDTVDFVVYLQFLQQITSLGNKMVVVLSFFSIVLLMTNYNN